MVESNKQQAENPRPTVGMNGKLVLVIGPSGSGKSSLVSHVRKQHPEFVYPTSCTTRAPRPGEEDGDVYHFLSEESFDKHIEQDAFLEWASYGGNRYGTLKSEIIEPLKAGKVVIREIEVQGARSILKILPRENVAIIFIDAGSWDHLEERITNRATVHADELALRKARYEDEWAFAKVADYLIENSDGNLVKAKALFDEAIETVVASVQ